MKSEFINKTTRRYSKYELIILKQRRASKPTFWKVTERESENYFLLTWISCKFVVDDHSKTDQLSIIKGIIPLLREERKRKKQKSQKKKKKEKKRKLKNNSS